jgi:hypothetical protein
MAPCDFCEAGEAVWLWQTLPMTMMRGPVALDLGDSVRICDLCKEYIDTNGAEAFLFYVGTMNPSIGALATHEHSEAVEMLRSWIYVFYERRVDKPQLMI